MIHRRDAMLRLGSAACGALTLPRLMSAEQFGKVAAKRSAKSSIVLFA